jgi:hypothetical protein
VILDTEPVAGRIDKNPIGHQPVNELLTSAMRQQIRGKDEHSSPDQNKQLQKNASQENNAWAITHYTRRPTDSTIIQ